MIEIDTKGHDDFDVQDGMLYLDGAVREMDPYPCTGELVFLLVDFLNMGIRNVLVGGGEVYACEAQLEYDLLNDLYEVGFAERKVDFEGNDTYVPSVIYGMVAEKLINAVAEEVEKE